MSHLNLRVPGSTNPYTHNKTIQADKSGQSAPGSQSKTIELRIIQDGRIYRSKAEQERLKALGQWHHRRQRRRNRLRS